MDFVDIFKLVDSSVAVIAVLFIGWRVQLGIQQLMSNQQDIILKLIEICGDDDEKEAP